MLPNTFLMYSIEKNTYTSLLVPTPKITPFAARRYSSTKKTKSSPSRKYFQWIQVYFLKFGDFTQKKGQNNSLKWYHWMHLDSSSPKKLAIKPTVLGPYKTQQTRPKTPRCCWPHCRLLPQLFEEMATIGISVRQQCCFTTQKT